MEKKPILWKLSYWVILWLVLSVFSALYDQLWAGAFLLNLTRIPLMALSAWIIFDQILYSRNLNIPIKIIFSLLIIITAGLFSRLLFGLFVFPYHFSSEYDFQFFNLFRITSQFIVFLGGIGGYATIRYFNEKKEWQKKNELLEKEKKEAELNFLKAQIHPHFLFNTLNAVYNESLKKSDKAPEMILKLSDMLRSVLYDSENKLIPLSKELKLIDDYTGLEMMRFGKRLNLNFENKIDPNAEIKIPAFSLFALVENAFKHGVSDSMDESFIKMTLETDNKNLKFSIRNSLRTDQNDEMGSKKGIGLANIRRQLEIIYGSEFQLDQKKDEKGYLSILSIPLK